MTGEPGANAAPHPSTDERAQGQDALGLGERERAYLLAWVGENLTLVPPTPPSSPTGPPRSAPAATAVTSSSTAPAADVAPTAPTSPHLARETASALA